MHLMTASPSDLAKSFDCAVNTPPHETLRETQLQKRDLVAQQQAMIAGLRSIVDAADQLITAADEDDLCYRAVQLARKSLGLERCGVGLVQGDWVRATYGTNLQGETTDERSFSMPISEKWRDWLELGRRDNRRFERIYTPYWEWVDGAFQTAGHGSGWQVVTPIQSALRPLGLMFNDTARSGAPYEPDKQELVAVYCSLLGDMIERKRAEDSLQKSEAKLRALLNHTPDSIMLVDADATIRYINHTAPGLKVDDVLGATCYDYLSPDHARRLRAAMRSAFDQKQVSQIELDGHGDTYWVTRIVPIQEAGQVVSAMQISTDVTEQRRAAEDLRRRESELAHVNRLSTMGEMVAEIAHELNQPLYAISNFAEACANCLADQASGERANDKVRGWISQILQQAARAGQIMDRLRAFAAPTPPHRSEVDLVQVVRETIELMNFELRRARIEPDVVAEIERAVVTADPVQMQQVIVNLLGNAIEAMADLPETDRGVTIRISSAENQAVVDIADRGPGVPEELQARIFEALYTNKAQGMGLGLAISRSIVEAHGGTLSLEATAAGSLFRIRIPRTEEN
jgi:PAS domain S-box-containing protein